MFKVTKELVALIRSVSEHWPRVLDATERVLGLTGRGITNTPRGITITQPPVKNSTPAAGKPATTIEVQRMRVTSLGPESNPRLVVARTWDGTTQGGTDFIVRKISALSIGSEFDALLVAGGTDQTFGGAPVVWKQNSIPAPTAKYQGLFVLDDFQNIAWTPPMVA